MKSALHLLATQWIAVCAAVVSTVGLCHTLWLARVDRRPRLRITQRVDKDDVYFWRFINTGRVPVTLDRCGILIWAGWWGPAALLGRRRAREFWLQPIFELGLPHELAPLTHCEAGVPYDQILRCLQGAGLGRRLTIQPICEDQTERRYRGKAEIVGIGLPDGIRLRWWWPFGRRV